MINKKEKDDRRVLYTKKVLRESLMNLLKEKPIQKITTTELCCRADINRNTFYSHYDNPEAMLCSIEEELFEQIKFTMNELIRNESNSNLLSQVFDLIIVNSDLCNLLFSDYGDKAFISRVANLPHDWTMAKWKAAGIIGDDMQLELLYLHNVYGTISAIQYWIQGGMKKSQQELVLFLIQANHFGLTSFFK